MMLVVGLPSIEEQVCSSKNTIEFFVFITFSFEVNRSFFIERRNLTESLEWLVVLFWGFITFVFEVINECFRIQAKKGFVIKIFCLESWCAIFYNRFSFYLFRNHFLYIFYLNFLKFSTWEVFWLGNYFHRCYSFLVVLFPKTEIPWCTWQLFMENLHKRVEELGGNVVDDVRVLF